jgi:hypothetical protein
MSSPRSTHTAPAITATLTERVTAAENARHAKRLAEIKRMASKLRQFEPDFQKLAAHGIHIHLDQLFLNYEGYLSVTTGLSGDQDAPLYNALLDLGFKQGETPLITARYAIVPLKKRQLTISLMIRPECLRTDAPSSGAPHQPITPVHTSASAAATGGPAC